MTSVQAIHIVVNGEGFEVPDGSNISSVLNLLKLPGDRVAVELNKSLIRKRDWQATRVSSGARLEVVEFVGGG